MSRFPAELVVTLSDGRAVTECFNQAEMAQFTRANMLDRLRRGEALVLFDGEAVEIPATQVSSVQVIVQDRVAV